MFALCAIALLNGLGMFYLRSEFEEFFHDIAAFYLLISAIIMSFAFSVCLCTIFIQKMKNGNKPK